jgi:hypothetical protein
MRLSVFAALALLFAGCTTYRPKGDPHTFATISGVREKQGALGGYSVGVAAIDGASTPFNPRRADEPRQVTAALHALQLQFVGGGQRANAFTTLRFEPRRHYTVRVRVHGERVIIWIEEGGRHVTSDVVATKGAFVTVPAS